MGNTHKKRGEEDGCQGDESSHHHLGGYLGPAATHDGCEDLKHHPDEEHEVDVRQRQAEQIEHAVLHWGSWRRDTEVAVKNNTTYYFQLYFKLKTGYMQESWS